MPPSPSQEQAEFQDAWDKLANKIRNERYLTPRDCEATIATFPNIRRAILGYRSRLVRPDGTLNGECVAKILDAQGIPTKYRVEVASIMIIELTGK